MRQLVGQCVPYSISWRRRIYEEQYRKPINTLAHCVNQIGPKVTWNDNCPEIFDQANQ